MEMNSFGFDFILRIEYNIYYWMAKHLNDVPVFMGTLNFQYKDIFYSSSSSMIFITALYFSDSQSHLQSHLRIAKRFSHYYISNS